MVLQRSAKKRCTWDFLPLHALYFILFLLPAIVFCVAEELVVLITTCPLSAFNHSKLQGVSDVSISKKAA